MMRKLSVRVTRGWILGCCISGEQDMIDAYERDNTRK